MKFFADQDVYNVTIEFLKRQGHDVICAKEVDLSMASDEELVVWAKENKRILVTRDKGYGALVFVNHIENAGIILLRIDPTQVQIVHKEFALFLSKHSDKDISNCFCVIDSRCYRIRKISIHN